MSERLPSIDEDISSGAVVFGNPEKKARPCNANVLKVKTRVSQYAINHQTKTHRQKTEVKLYTLFGRTCKVTTPNWRRQDAAWQGEAAGEKDHHFS